MLKRFSLTSGLRLTKSQQAEEREMTETRILKVGIAPRAVIQQRTIDIAAGRRKRGQDEPQVWLPSIGGLSQVLSEKNRLLLELIKRSKPETLQDLARLSDRQKG